MKLMYEGVDITSMVSINLCEHETYAEGRSDVLLIRFNDSASLWSKWKPVRGEKVRLVSGSNDTGDMYITSIAPENGLYTLRAMSMPLSGDNIKSKSWAGVKFLQIANDIATAHGLSLKTTSSIVDQQYTQIDQERLTDFEFLHRLCQLEGCAMLIYDGKLIIYDEHEIESKTANETIKIGKDGRFQYCDNTANGYKKAVVIAGEYKGEYADHKANYDRVLQPRDVISCSSDAEAKRFAKGLLRAANKNSMTGSFRQKLSRGIAAGSIINIKTDKAKGWDGKVFVTKTRHDFLNGETKVFFRKPLEGY